MRIERGGAIGFERRWRLSNGNYIAGADALDRWRDALYTGTLPTLYAVGAGALATVEIGPGLVTLIGGAPGAGKTALTMQFVIDALRLDQALRAVVCNVEMAPEALLDRQLARVSGIDLADIRYRRLGTDHADRLDQGFRTLEAVGDRLAFLRPPFDLANVAATADVFGADLIVLDYIQRIRPPGVHDDRRGSVDATMDYIRQFADAGVAVLVVGAVARTRDARGRSSYASDGLSLASFRESSELEYGADSAFLLVPEDDAGSETVVLRCLKDRNGERRDVVLRFDRARQSFMPVVTAGTPVGAGRTLESDADSRWR